MIKNTIVSDQDLTLAKIIKRFNLKILANKKDVNDKKINNPSVNRVGLELCGKIIYKELWTLVYLGSKEYKFLDSLDEKTRIERIENVFKLNPPAIILGKNFHNSDFIIKIGKKFSIPVLSADMSFYEINFTITNYMTEKLCSYNMHHGTLVNVYGVGVLLTGKSGVGKSEAAIELIKKGHMFVADDAIRLSRLGNRLMGVPERATKDFIEVRGLGILNFSRTFGQSKIMSRSEIKLGIELIKINGDEKFTFERLGKTLQYKNVQGVKLPYYIIPVIPGRKIGDIIETAVTDFKLKNSGYNSAKAFVEQTSKNWKEDK